MVVKGVVAEVGILQTRRSRARDGRSGGTTTWRNMSWIISSGRSEIPRGLIYFGTKYHPFDLVPIAA